MDKTAESRGWSDRNAGSWQPKGLVGDGNKRERQDVFFIFVSFSPTPVLIRTGRDKIRRSPCKVFTTTLKCWHPAMPCPAPGTGLVKDKLLKMSWDGNCNKHLNWMKTEFTNRRKVWSIKKIFRSIYLKAVTGLHSLWADPTQRLHTISDLFYPCFLIFEITNYLK